MQPELTVAETVALYAAYYPDPRPVSETIELVGLADQCSQPAGKLSGGQQRRLDVAIALVGRPELLFLDEPTTGFDPSARRAAWSLIAGLRDLGATVFLTTHYLEEAEALAGRVAIIRAGEVVATGTPDGIGGGSRAVGTVRFRLPAGIEGDDLPRGLGGDVHIEAGVFHVRTTALVADLHEVTGWALERGLDLADLRVSRPTLEDVYLELTAEVAS